jgi:hypothetical protein
MRDPWFPVVLMFIVLVAIWLGIVGPMPNGVADWLQKWQTLAAASVASIAAYIAYRNTTRSIRNAEELEKHRRSRKHAALRAVLPLALVQVTNYAERSAHALNDLVNKCNGETLPAKTATRDSLLQPLPSETLKTLSDFIEYSDNVETEVIEATIARIQIHDSRLHELAKANHDPSRVVVRAELEARIIDAASIYAGAAAVYDYARRRQTQLPPTLSWDMVGASLKNMSFWDDEYPRLAEILKSREETSAGPFEN